MTTLDLIAVLVASLIGFGAGLVSGLMVQYRRHVDDDGKVTYRPTFIFNAKRIDALLSIGVVITMVSTVLFAAYNNEQERECNMVLRDLIAAREFSSENSRDANTQLIEELIVNRPADSEEADAEWRAGVIARYKARQDEIDQYLEDHPVPEPTRGCGL